MRHHPLALSYEIRELSRRAKISGAGLPPARVRRNIRRGVRARRLQGRSYELRCGRSPRWVFRRGYDLGQTPLIITHWHCGEMLRANPVVPNAFGVTGVWTLVHASIGTAGGSKPAAE
jgi:hypothetical protein